VEVISTIQPRGLSDDEAENRRILFGHNQLEFSKKPTLFKIVLGVFKEPVFQLLCAAGLVYFLLGDILDAAVLSIFVLLSASISILQQRRADRVLDRLRALAAPRALVVRAAAQRRIAATQVVPGDLVVLAEGDRVPADIRLLSCQELYIDESLLTGESMPVQKTPRQRNETGMVRLGCLVVRGQGLGRVIATGLRTEFGKIGQAAVRLTEPPGRLERDIGRLVRIFTACAAVVSLMVFAANYGVVGDAIAAILAGITAAMGLIPEEFAVVLVTFMAMGAWRISQHHVLTRRRTAIERLGSATVLCADKTGTLTQNQMQVALLSTDGRTVERIHGKPSQRAQQLLSDAARACAEHSADPTDRAILDCLDDTRKGDQEIQADLGTKTYGLTAEFSAMTTVSLQSSGRLRVVMKGAPEAVLSCCSLLTAQRSEIYTTIAEMASQGSRVLGVATAEWDRCTPLPSGQQEFRLSFSGLIGLADPLRPLVPEAIGRCKTAGIRVVMITGDHPVTALAISEQAGLVDRRATDLQTLIITGDVLEQMSESELAQRIENCCIYARIKPNQKLRIVQAYQQAGHVVAMTGDGVNDSPALKSADIGIAMGCRGTDVAREASALVLLDDDFSSIVYAIERGRQIYQNLRKAIGFIVTIHIPIAGLAALPGFIGLAPLLLPVHIAFMEMIIDPAGSFVYESQRSADDLMRQPPRDPRAKILSYQLLIKSVIQGLAVLLVLALAAAWALNLPIDQAEVRSLVFVGLVASSLAIVTANLLGDRPTWDLVKTPNIALLIISAVAVGLLHLIVWIPGLRSAFHFAAVAPWWFLAALAVGWFNYVILRLIQKFFRSERASTP
jgi:Ca2+-transporting ATPase